MRTFNQTKAAIERHEQQTQNILHIKDVNNLTMVIRKVRGIQSKFGPAFVLTVKFRSSGEEGVLIGSWKGLQNVLDSYVKNPGDLPVIVRVIQRRNETSGQLYYDFIDPTDIYDKVSETEGDEAGTAEPDEDGAVQPEIPF